MMSYDEAKAAYKAGKISGAELFAVMRKAPKKPVFGGTFEIHYTDPQCGKMVAYVEAYSDKQSGTRKAAIEKAVEEQHIPQEWITMVKRYD